MNKELILKLKKEYEEKLAKLLEQREIEINAKVDEYKSNLINELESEEILEVRKIIAGLDEMLCPPVEEKIEEALNISHKDPEVIASSNIEEIPVEEKQEREIIHCSENDIGPVQEEITCEEVPCEAETLVEYSQPVEENTCEETPVEIPVEAEAPVTSYENITVEVKEEPIREVKVETPKPTNSRNLFGVFNQKR